MNSDFEARGIWIQKETRRHGDSRQAAALVFGGWGYKAVPVERKEDFGFGTQVLVWFGKETPALQQGVPSSNHRVAGAMANYAQLNIERSGLEDSGRRRSDSATVPPS
jgi:hypothetical protein